MLCINFVIINFEIIKNVPDPEKCYTNYINKRLKSRSLCKNNSYYDGIEPGPPAKVSSVITTTLLRMI